MLEIRDIHAGYGKGSVLEGLSLTARRGEVLCVMGRNGAGKTTTMRAIMGQLRLTGGDIALDGQVISNLPAHIVPRHGIGYIPQGRRLFAEMTVAENIEIGMMARQAPATTRDRVLEMFPRLSERLGQQAGTLSGGEQQMLATARAMCLDPSVMLLDEPTEGLQPSMIALIRDAVRAMRAADVAVILVEQRADAVRDIADHVAFIEHGRTARVATVADLDAEPDLLHRYVGV